MSVDLDSLLDSNIDEVKRPPTLPAGNYTGVISQRQYGKSRDGKETPMLTYTVQLTGALEDAQAAMDDLQLEVDWTTKKVTKDFWLDKDSLYVLTELLQGLGIRGMSTREGIEAAVGSPVAVYIVQEMDKKDSSKVYNRVKQIRAE